MTSMYVLSPPEDSLELFILYTEAIYHKICYLVLGLVTTFLGTYTNW